MALVRSLVHGGFADDIVISNPDYGAFVPVTLRLDLKWDRSYSLGVGGANFAQDWAIAQMGLEWMGNFTLYNLVRTDNPGERLELSGVFSGGALNHQTLNFWGNLDVLATVSLNTQGTVAAPFAIASAFSGVDAVYSIKVPAGTTITSSSGRDLIYHASNNVPDASSTAGLCGSGLLALALFGWRRPCGKPGRL